MSTMTLKSLVEKLSPQSKQALEAAAAACSSRSHFTVELQHWLLAICDLAMSETGAGDMALIARSFSVNLAELRSQLQQRLEPLKTGNATTPGLSPQLVSLLRAGWMVASLDFADRQIRTAHLVYALLNDDSLGALACRLAPQLEKIEPAQLLQTWPSLVAESDEISARHHSQQAQASDPLPGDKAHSLAQFTIDLTAQARQGKLDPILGRDTEIRQMIDILTRRRQNNPILTGEAGVGKTAVVEGLAQRIADGDVPTALQGTAIRVLDLALLQAGAGMKGEFENRLKSVIKEVKASAQPIILFIDEAHTLIGSGGQAGQNDAANLLKPALARGELRTIAATTWAEYKKYFEKDAALTRRFQLVKVDEPDEETAVIMMRGLMPVMEQHHKVAITDKALQAAVRLSHRYINGRQLPDKAVALLDTACARVAMSQASTPGQVEQRLRRQQQISAEIAQLDKEAHTGTDHSGQLNQLKEELECADKALQDAQTQWRDEKGLVEKARHLISQLTSEAPADAEAQANLQAIKQLLADNPAPMVHLLVDESLVAEVIADWTGIPLGRMQRDEIDTILSLSQRMGERIIGQGHALAQISQVVHTARAQLNDERKPNGVFLLTGPSGVGKTETALALAEQIYGSEDNLTTINMSEFKEEHKVSLLLGSPPGYVGFGEGGVLTEAVRRKPYSVVLLDEIEKAHPGVQDIFYQVFDKGTIKDGEGRNIDFKNTIIILTSNIGSETTLQLFEDEQSAPSIEGLTRALKEELLQVFKPAFLGRLSVIPYLPLNTDMLSAIIRLQLQRIADRVDSHYNATFCYDDAVIDYLICQGQDENAGARVIQNHLQNVLLPQLSEQLLKRVAQQQVLARIEVTIVDDRYQFRFD